MELPEEGRYWLHQQFRGAIVFIALTASVVALRCIVAELLNRKAKKHPAPFSAEALLLQASLAAFIPLCVCAIGKSILCAPWMALLV